MNVHFKGKQMKVNELDIGKWFFLNHKWYRLSYKGRKNVKAEQIGSPKVYTFQIDTEVKEQ